MSERKAKAIRRTIRKNQTKLLAQSLSNTLRENWQMRLRTGVYIASGGKMWFARVVVWCVTIILAYNLYQLSQLIRG